MLRDRVRGPGRNVRVPMAGGLTNAARDIFPTLSPDYRHDYRPNRTCERGAPASRQESVRLAASAVAEAGQRRALVVCFPECFVPGYRWPGTPTPPQHPSFLERTWADVAHAARTAAVTVILGTERITDRGLQISVCVIDTDGTIAGWQDKGQLDPSEETTYPAFATERRVFAAGPLTFGVVICHEGWRYPETVRWVVRRGAQVVFHPHAHVAEPGSYRPVTFADPANTFHEKAILCRAAENTCSLRR